MAKRMALLLLTTAMAVLVLMAGSAAAQQHDCQSQYGPGCSNCVNVTMSMFGHRKLLQYQPQVSAQHARGGRFGHGRGNGSFDGRGDQGPGSFDGHEGRGMPPRDGSVLVCTACDTIGYALRTETRGSVTVGRCECAPGWGVQLVNATDEDMLAYRYHTRDIACVSCSLTNQVPLTNSSGVSLTYSNGTWALVLGSTGNYSWYSAWGFGRHRRGNFDGATTPPPYYMGQCITCPEGSAPSTDFASCVATSTTSSVAAAAIEDAVAGGK